MISNSTLSPFSIHGRPDFINFEFSFFTVPMLLTITPILYIPATFVVVSRIFSKLFGEFRDKHVNMQLLGVISLSNFMSLLFFVSEFLYLRLPMTGLLTSWCASVEPNGYLIVLTVTTYYLNYSLMLFPFLVALLRLNLIVFPSQHRKINETILKFSIPLVFIYPFFLTFFMFTGSGYCTYMDYFLSSGALVMRITDTLFGITNTYPLMFNTFFWFSTSFTLNLTLIWKLIHYKLTLSAHAKSQKSHKAEISLTLTTISMTCSYLTNGMITICGLFFPSIVLYLIVLRPFTNDLETCLVPWVLYLTHPIFAKKKASDNIILVSSVEKLQA